MRIASRRKTIAFFLVLGICLVALAIALDVGWIILNWRQSVMLFLGVIVFATIILGMILNTTFLVREIRLNEQHGSFINAVTHELKTPITSIRLYLETLQRREIEEAQRQHFYQLMLDDTDRLMGTVEQVLKAGQVGYKRGEQYRAKVDLGNLAAECMELARTRHHLSPGALHFASANGQPGRDAGAKDALLTRPVTEFPVHGDPEELRTAISNVLDNAIKYSVGNVDVSVVIEAPDEKTRGASRARSRRGDSRRPAQARVQTFSPCAPPKHVESERHGPGPFHRSLDCSGARRQSFCRKRRRKPGHHGYAGVAAERR
jgi:two-component system sensor histidine kinase SenX3